MASRKAILAVRNAIAIAIGTRNKEWSGEGMPSVAPDAVGWVRLALAATNEGRTALADNWALGEREALNALLFSFLSKRSFELPAPRFGEREAAYVRRVAELMLSKVTFEYADTPSWVRTISFLSSWAASAEHVMQLRGGRDLKIVCSHIAPGLFVELRCDSLAPELERALEQFERAISKRAYAQKGIVPQVTEILVAAATPESGELARRALFSASAHQRWSILLALSSRPQVAQKLTPQLSKLAEKGQRWEERWAAVQALPVNKRTEVLLRRVLKEDPNAMVRSAAQAKLRGAKSRDALDSLTSWAKIAYNIEDFRVWKSWRPSEHAAGYRDSLRDL